MHATYVYSNFRNTRNVTAFSLPMQYRAERNQGNKMVLANYLITRITVIKALGNFLFPVPRIRQF